jgi:hypothetical protein
MRDASDNPLSQPAPAVIAGALASDAMMHIYKAASNASSVTCSHSGTYKCSFEWVMHADVVDAAVASAASRPEAPGRQANLTVPSEKIQIRRLS